MRLISHHSLLPAADAPVELSAALPHPPGHPNPSLSTHAEQRRTEPILHRHPVQERHGHTHARVAILSMCRGEVALKSSEVEGCCGSRTEEGGGDSEVADGVGEEGKVVEVGAWLLRIREGGADGERWGLKGGGRERVGRGRGSEEEIIGQRGRIELSLNGGDDGVEGRIDVREAEQFKDVEDGSEGSGVLD